ncbi:MAG: glutaredoxin family protein [Thiobacillaceae bacterium]
MFLSVDARSGLQELQSVLAFRVSELDIDRDFELARRYGSLVPVLELDGREVCHYFLDVQALRDRLSAVKATRTGTEV